MPRSGTAGSYGNSIFSILRIINFADNINSLLGLQEKVTAVKTLET